MYAWYQYHRDVDGENYMERKGLAVTHIRITTGNSIFPVFLVIQIVQTIKCFDML